ncbi:MAG: hypothetical protein IJ814_06575 [Paludibacteraceae bacterium]|nr:hypothetical protein [Paludibacteraceae bacterium]
MKINPIMTVLSLALAALVAYALYSYCHNEELQWIITILGGVSIFLTWAGTMAVSVEDQRRNINFKVFNGIFAGIVTVMQFVFALTTAVSKPTYILTTGVVTLIWLMAAYALGRPKSNG